MHPAIAQHRAAIGEICRQFGIERLDVFGSAARGHDFDASASDADFLVEFTLTSDAGLQRYFGVKEALERLLGRSVDLIEPGAVRNPFLLKSIGRSCESIYAA